MIVFAVVRNMIIERNNKNMIKLLKLPLRTLKAYLSNTSHSLPQLSNKNKETQALSNLKRDNLFRTRKTIFINQLPRKRRDVLKMKP